MISYFNLPPMGDTKTSKAILQGINQLPDKDIHVLFNLDKQLAPLLGTLPLGVRDELRMKRGIEWQGFTLCPIGYMRRAMQSYLSSWQLA